jgi:hypothetical protein
LNIDHTISSGDITKYLLQLKSMGYLDGAMTWVWLSWWIFVYNRRRPPSRLNSTGVTSGSGYAVYSDHSRRSQDIEQRIRFQLDLSQGFGSGMGCRLDTTDGSCEKQA